MLGHIKGSPNGKFFSFPKYWCGGVTPDKKNRKKRDAVVTHSKQKKFSFHYCSYQSVIFMCLEILDPRGVHLVAPSLASGFFSHTLVVGIWAHRSMEAAVASGALSYWGNFWGSEPFELHRASGMMIHTNSARRMQTWALDDDVTRSQISRIYQVR